MPEVQERAKSRSSGTGTVCSPRGLCTPSGKARFWKNSAWRRRDAICPVSKRLVLAAGLRMDHGWRRECQENSKKCAKPDKVVGVGVTLSSQIHRRLSSTNLLRLDLWCNKKVGVE